MNSKRSFLLRAGSIALLLLPIVLSAAEVCIWQYDPLDRYYEPELGDSAVSSYGLQTALTGLGLNCIYVEALPTDLSSFDLVCVSLGWYRC
jgi:hypothetical protein